MFCDFDPRFFASARFFKNLAPEAVFYLFLAPFLTPKRSKVTSGRVPQKTTFLNTCFFQFLIDFGCPVAPKSLGQLVPFSRLFRARGLILPFGHPFLDFGAIFYVFLHFFYFLLFFTKGFHTMFDAFSADFSYKQRARNRELAAES